MSKQEIYTLEIDAEAYQLLRAAKRKNETFSAIIRRGFWERLPRGVKRITDKKLLEALERSLERERAAGKVYQAKSCLDLLK